MGILKGVYWKIPISIITGCLAFSETEWILIISLLIWMILDTITGIFASLKRNEKIQSRKLFRLSVKVFVYFFGTVGVKSLVMSYPALEAFAVQSFLSFFLLTEIKSFAENVKVLELGISDDFINMIKDTILRKK